MPTLAQAPYCFAAPLHLDFTRAGNTNDAAPATPYPANAGRATRPGVSVIVHVRSAELPPSPARARLCVNADGSVATVEPPISALRTTRYVIDGPAGVGFCDDVVTR